MNVANVCTSGLDIGFASLSYVQVGILGVVQGVTELLPISSIAHMRVVPALLGWRDPGSAFSAAMQLAALAAVISYFWRDVRMVMTGIRRLFAIVILIAQRFVSPLPSFLRQFQLVSLALLYHRYLMHVIRH